MTMKFRFPTIGLALSCACLVLSPLAGATQPVQPAPPAKVAQPGKAAPATKAVQAVKTPQPTKAPPAAKAPQPAKVAPAAKAVHPVKTIRTVRTTKKVHPLKVTPVARAVPLIPLVPLAPSTPASPDPAKLELAAGSAMVVDLDSDKVLFASYPDAVVPIASISKLMTAVVTLDASLPMDEVIPVTIDDTRELRGVYSRVRVNSRISRMEMLRLALMSSENRAASALAHNYPGGHARFVAAMNAKAHALGMSNSHFVEPTGLSERNVSTARDLVRLLKAAREYPLIRMLSTTPSKTAYFQRPNYVLGFNNTNPLTRDPSWDIEVTKTGFINEAGHCLALLTRVSTRPLAIVILDTQGKRTHIADASRVRRWLETGSSGPIPAQARYYKQQRSMQLRQAVAGGQPD